MSRNPELPDCKIEFQKFEKEISTIEAIPAIKHCEPLIIKTG